LRLRDGVMTMLITILVLELKVLHDADFRVLIPLLPMFMSYVLSFVYVGIYWNKLQYECYPSLPLDLMYAGFRREMRK
jgi:uncharacterized membrane protein